MSSDITSGDPVASRLEKLKRIEALGLDPWGGRFDSHLPIDQILAMPADLQDDQRPRVKAAGRIVSRRIKGKLHFIDLWDASGKPQMRKTREQEGKHDASEYLGYSSQIQLMLGAKQVGETGWALARELDLGDLIGVEGSFKDQDERPTIFVDKLVILEVAGAAPGQVGRHVGHQYRLRHRYLDLTIRPRRWNEPSSA